MLEVQGNRLILVYPKYRSCGNVLIIEIISIEKDCYEDKMKSLCEVFSTLPYSKRM